MRQLGSERGQMLLVVVLTMIVALTVGLSVASRTISNLKISKQSEESQRAFQAAEAGVEQILQAAPDCTPGSNCSSLNFSQNNSEYSTKVAYPSGTSFLLNGSEIVDQDSGIDLWLSDHPDFTNQIASSTITVYWGTENQTSCTNPGGATGPSSVRSAMEIVVLSGNKLTPTFAKYLVEATGCTRIPNAEIAGAGATPPGSTIFFQNSKTMTVNNGLIARVIPIFNSSKVAIVSSSSLPKQGTVVESVGKSGNTVRKVEYFSSYPQIPLEVFPYSLITQ